MNIKPIASLLLLSALAGAGIARGQVGETLRPPARNEPVRVQPAPAPARVPGDLSARPRRGAAIPATGPSPAAASRPGMPKAEDAPRIRATATAKVYDRTGRQIPGAVRVGPNRVFDPASGRYYNAQPRGEDLQIVPGG